MHNLPKSKKLNALASQPTRLCGACCARCLSPDRTAIPKCMGHVTCVCVTIGTLIRWLCLNKATEIDTCSCVGARKAESSYGAQPVSARGRQTSMGRSAPPPCQSGCVCLPAHCFMCMCLFAVHHSACLLTDQLLCLPIFVCLPVCLPVCVLHMCLVQNHSRTIQHVSG